MTLPRAARSAHSASPSAFNIDPLRKPPAAGGAPQTRRLRLVVDEQLTELRRLVAAHAPALPGCAIVLALVLGAAGWTVAPGTGFVLMILPLLLYAVASGRADTSSAHQRHLREWAEAYSRDMRTLLTTGLPLLVAEDDAWLVLCGSGVNPLTKVTLQLPRTCSERLVYAAVFWEQLGQYAGGKREGLDLDMHSRQLQLRAMLTGTVRVSGDDLASRARFTALYDYFYGDMEELGR